MMSLYGVKGAISSAVGVLKTSPKAESWEGEKIAVTGKWKGKPRGKEVMHNSIPSSSIWQRHFEFTSTVQRPTKI
jgi:hypothetical protein